MKCSVCGFEHDTLVRDTPYLGVLCYKCFDQQYWDLSYLCNEWEENITSEIIGDARDMLDSDISPVEIYKKYPLYVMEDIFKSVLLEELTPEKRDKIILFLYSDEYRDLQERLGDSGANLFVRSIEPFGEINILKLKGYLEELYSSYYEWSDYVEAYFIRRIILNKYCGKSGLHSLKLRYRDWLCYLKDAAYEVLALKIMEEGTSDYQVLQEFVESIEEEMHADWVRKQVEELKKGNAEM